MTRATTASQRLKTVTCRDCGEPMQAGSNARLPQRCVGCGLVRMRANLYALRDKAGPEYENWRNKLLQALSK